MLVVLAIGGSALLRAGGGRTADNQRACVRMAAQAIAPIAAGHQLVISHGNGPQSGLLALQGAACAQVETYSFDVLGAQTEGVIDYMIEQELGNLLPGERPFATMQTMVEVDPDDPAFQKPSCFIGPVYLREEADRMAAERGWAFKPVGDKWRRVVASPEPRRIFELSPIKWLLERNAIVLAAGGGGIPAICASGSDRRLTGVECVVDKDLAAGLLARELDADVFIMLTDIDAVYTEWGTPAQTAVRRASPAALRAVPFARSMAPKVSAACRFAEVTGRKAAIGALADVSRILSGQAGTTISAAETGIVHAAPGAPARIRAVYPPSATAIATSARPSRTMLEPVRQGL